LVSEPWVIPGRRRSNGIKDSITVAKSGPVGLRRADSGTFPAKEGAHEACCCGVLVERAAPTSNFPILSKTNYADWATVMRVMLQVRVLWDAVNINMMDFTEDRLALEALSRAVPLELSGTIAGKATTHITWEGIKTSRVGDDRVCKSKAGTLKQEFDALKFRSGEMVDDFAMRITSITNRLSVLGEGIEEEVIEQKFL
jgi:hypothetical protein